MKDNRNIEIKRLNKEITNAKSGKVVEAELRTSERVLQRVTDGIYRQPSSALRELVANSYDADATLVEIQTDPPRFERIIVRDNGNGLTTEALVYLIKSIGGSAKRTSKGEKIGICRKDNYMRSPGGRKLIGKIGIGLFSVAQLTKQFQIITKTKNTEYRTIADVVLHTHTEDVDSSDDEYTAGTVRIWRVPAPDLEAQGTQIILRNLLKQKREDLTSREMWLRCNPVKRVEVDEIISVPDRPPAYHIGCVYKDRPNVIEQEASLPWESSDSPEKRFRKLVEGMYELRGKRRNPSVEDDLDYYLRTLWILGLSLPLDYVDGHPFDISKEDGLKTYRIGNDSKDQAVELNIAENETIRKELGLVSPERGSAHDFKVIIDGVQLFRPIKFRRLPKTLESVPYSLLFVGKADIDLSSYPEEVRGGNNLKFEAYFFWNHVIIPKEHAGVMIRISDASGVLFDSTFMQYPISELTRKNQLTAEVFITKGLDAALNIDRESFNYSHPHYQYLTHWIHNAFRQFSNKHKTIAKEIRESTRHKQSQKELNELESRVEKTIRIIRPDPDIPLPHVEFANDENEQAEKRKAGILSFLREDIFEYRTQKPISRYKKRLEDEKFENKIMAVIRLLDAYGVFNDMTYEKQQSLLRDIVMIFS